MKIIYLHQYFNTPDMGGSTRSYEMAKRWVEAGHHVDIVTSFRDRKVTEKHQAEWANEVIDGINVHWLSVPYNNSMGFIARVRAFLAFALKAGKKAKSLGGDVVFATSTPLTIAIPGVSTAKTLKVPMVFEVRDLWPDVPIALGALKNPLLKWLAVQLEHYAYRNSHRVIALSDGMAKGVISTGYSEHFVDIVPNSSDLDLFDERNNQAAQFLEQHPELSGAPLLLYAGTLGKVNGVGYLVDVASALKRNNSSIKCVVIGTGAEKESILARAKAQRVWQENFYIYEPIPKHQLVGAFHAATITSSFVIDVPALEANSANKFFDSLAASRPIAINHGGWQADLIKQEHIGLVLSRDPQQAALSLADYVSKPEAIELARRNARAVAEQRFSRDTLSANILHKLQESVQQKDTAPTVSCFSWFKLGKRLVDIVGSLTLLIVLSPLLVALYLLVSVKLGRPAIFKQRRPGRFGRLFTLYKFRTMLNATNSRGELLPDEQRMTRFGQLLRSASLDELPELWNILKGDMSFVGPRPLLEEYLPLYDDTQSLRHAVRPGLTGWAQVNGRNSVSWEQKFDLDVFYVRNQRWSLDIKVLFKTFSAVFKRSGITSEQHVTTEKFTGNQNKNDD